MIGLLFKLLFYWVYKLYQRRGDSQPQIYGWIVSSLIMALHVLLINWLISLFTFPATVLNEYSIIGAFILILVINYFIIFPNQGYLDFINEVEKRNLRKYNFLLVLYLVVLIVSNIITAGIQRSKYKDLKETRQKEIYKPSY